MPPNPNVLYCSWRYCTHPPLTFSVASLMALQGKHIETGTSTGPVKLDRCCFEFPVAFAVFGPRVGSSKCLLTFRPGAFISVMFDDASFARTNLRYGQPNPADEIRPTNPDGEERQPPV